MPVRLGGALLAEFIGTFALIFIGVFSVNHALALGGGHMTPGGLLLVAMAHGFAIAIMVSATIQTSGGHLNPSITIGFMVTRKIKPAAGIAYIITQLIAAVLASFAVYLISGGDPAAAAKILQGTPEFSGSAGLAVLAEIIATFFLAFVIWGSAADPRARNTGGFAIGMAVAADILAIGPITGASLNPSRSFGPTFVASLLQGGGSLWHHHWVYWVGPVVGSVLAATAYHVGLWPSDPKRGLDPAAVDVAKTLRPGAPEGA